MNVNNEQNLFKVKIKYGSTYRNLSLWTKLSVVSKKQKFITVK